MITLIRLQRKKISASILLAYLPPGQLSLSQLAINKLARTCWQAIPSSFLIHDRVSVHPWLRNEAHNLRISNLQYGPGRNQRPPPAFYRKFLSTDLAVASVAGKVRSAERQM
ncbi:hypothetical protein HZ326_27575 [Fusarium oxysporum f. sp. albedinis]|nr:hypothetical protein HZ326_27575 [Fusarium oxysporum f. sp. albedinis]